MAIVKTAVFDTWLRGLRDRRGAMKIARRIERMQDGDFGDHKPVGGGVIELRVIGAGPGYRVYFTMRGDTLVVLLCGGDKDSQQDDIGRARIMAKDVRT